MSEVAPARRRQLKLDAFAAWLAENGAEVGIPTNPYEVVRYRAFWDGSQKAITHLIYTKESGLLTYTGGSKAHYEAFLAGDHLPDTQAEATEGKRVRRVKNTAAIRAQLLARDGDCCWFCGKLLAAAESNVEHLIAISQGGTNALANLILAHNECNTKAGNMPVHKKLELRAKLRTEANA